MLRRHLFNEDSGSSQLYEGIKIPDKGCFVVINRFIAQTIVAILRSFRETCFRSVVSLGIGGARDVPCKAETRTIYLHFLAIRSPNDVKIT